MVRAETVGPRALAAARAATTPERLGADVMRLLDLVWPVLRQQGVRTGHNVVVYYAGEANTLTIDAGVETLTDFQDRGRSGTWLRHQARWPPRRTTASTRTSPPPTRLWGSGARTTGASRPE
jgi:hypothetical protein